VLPLPELMQSVTRDVHPPLYALLLHLFVSLFGDSEWALRLPSVIFGTASVGLTWAVAGRLGSSRAALIAALLTALAVYFVGYSQEARMYALLHCLALTSMLMLLRIDDCRRDSSTDSSGRAAGQGKANLTAYVLVTTLLNYSHVYGLFIVLAQNIYMAVRYLPAWQDKPALPGSTWVRLQIALGVLFAPWLVVLIRQVSRVQTGFWIEKPGLAELVQTVEIYVSSLPGLQISFVAVLLGLIALLLPADSRWSNLLAAPASGMARRSVALLLLAWLLTPVLVPFFVSQFAQPIYLSRYTIACASAWFILAAIGIDSLQNALLRYGLLVVLVLVLAGALPVYYLNDSKTDWPAVVEHLESQALPGDLVLFHYPDVLAPYRYYTGRDDLVLATVVAGGTWQAADAVDDDLPDVRPLAREHQQVWLVSGYDVNTAITELEIVNQLAEVHQPLGGREFSAIRVFRFGVP
jgi:mannosyltransferase